MSAPEPTPPVADPSSLTAGYTERSEEEMAAFTKVLERYAGGGHQYVAQPAKGFDVEGLWHTFPCTTRTGYTAHAVAIHSLLDALGVPTMLAPHPMMDIDVERFPKDREELLLRWTTQVVGVPEMMLASIPPDINLLRTRLTRAMAFYVAFEATRVSEYAMRLCNAEQMTALWCVTAFTAKSYIDSGVDPKKVFVVTPPMCDGPWKSMFSTDLTMRAAAARPVSTADPFVIGTLGTWHERKGFYDLIRAYFKAFKRADPVVLQIRTSYMGDGQRRLTLSEFEKKIVGEIAIIARECGDDAYPASGVMPRVQLLTGTSLTDEEVVRWLGSLDAYANPSYGEGLGIPPIWAAAQGVPIVSSRFGAVGDIFGGRGDCKLFDYRLAPVDKGMFKYGPIYDETSEWGRYDPEDLGRSLMRVVAEGRRRSLTLAHDIRREFSFDACRDGLIRALTAVARPELVAKWKLG